MLNIILATALTFSLQVVPVQAQQSQQSRCMPREGFVEFLKSEYAAIPVFVSIINKNNAIEVWLNTKEPEIQSWVMFKTDNEGEACMVAGGKGIGFFDPENESTPAPVARPAPKKNS